MHNLIQKARVIELRRMGYSYSLISAKTGISKATLSDWLSGIPYKPNKEVVDRIGKARAASGARHSEMKRVSLVAADTEARNEIGKFSQRDLLMFGLGLYLGEGAKTANAVRIVNSDPAVIAVAVAWFKAMGVSSEQFGPRIHLYPDSDIDQCIAFWARVIGVPQNQFQRSHVDTRTDKKSKKQGKLPYGTLHLSVRSSGNKKYGVFFFRKIQAMNALILQNIQRGRGLPV